MYIPPWATSFCGVVAPFFIALLSSQFASAASLVATVLDKKGMPLNDAVVTLHPLDAASPSNIPLLARTPETPAANTKTENTTLAQENLQFERYVTVIPVGTTIALPNRDRIEHHLKSFGPAQLFELKVYAPNANRSVLFDKPGASVLICYLHDWMRAWVYAVDTVDTPYYAKSDGQGQARINAPKNLSYEIRVWHPDMLAPPAPTRLSLINEASVVTLSTEAVPRPRKLTPSGTAVHNH